jgi:hypothetical protein
MKRLGLRFPAALAAVLASASAAALIWAGQAAAQQTITVCASGCQYTTIQEAINHASNGATIQIGAGTYGGFEAGRVQPSVRLEGAGAGKTIISGGGAGTVVRIVGGPVSISGVTITDGDGAGNPEGGPTEAGGIFNEGALTLNNSTVSGNTAGFSGGGIENRRELTLNNSTVSDNSADFEGGGIYNEGAFIEGSQQEHFGTLTLNNSTVSGNTSGVFGGGITNREGIATVNNSAISGNHAGEGGGGVFGFGLTTLNHSTVSENTANFGGGIYDRPAPFGGGEATTLKDSTVSDNHAERYGGGIFHERGADALENSSVSGNTAGLEGGGIFNEEGTVRLTNSGVSGNTAAVLGGGILNRPEGTVTLEDSKVTRNLPNNCVGTAC